MPSHTTPSSSTQAITDALAAFAVAVDETLSRGADQIDLLGVEERLRELAGVAERAAIAAVLRHLDEDVPVILIDGIEYKRAVRSDAPYMTSAGEVRVERTLYRAAGEKAVAAMDLRAGIVGGWLTPRAAKLACFVVAETTPGMAEEMFARVGGMTVSRSTLDRLPKVVSGDWEDRRLEYEAALRASVEIPEAAASVAVSLDGVMVPMKDGGGAEKRARTRAEGRPPSGPAGFREVGCGTMTLYDRDGNRLLTRRLGRMPEAGKQSLKNSLKAEVVTLLAAVPDLKLVKVADGARDNWRFLADELPQGAEVLDFFHAVEHLSAALACAYGEGSPIHARQLGRLRHKLRHERDGVERVIRALRHLHKRFPRRRVIERELAYFRNNRHRMSYAELADQALPIGSGVIEAACKTLATTRMKRSGMRWRHNGGQAILTLRALQQSGDFDAAWDLMHRDRIKAVDLPDSVIPLRRSVA